MSKAEVKRRLILEQTKALLVREGGAGLSMRKVADACGISLGNLQYHFATRDLLLEALLASFIKDYEQLRQPLEVRSTGRLREDLARLLADGLDALDRDDTGRLFKELWAAAQNAESLAAVLDRYYRDLADFYAETLRALCAGASEARIDRAVCLLLPLLEGYCVTRNVLRPDNRKLAEIWASAVAGSLEGEASPDP